MTAQNATLHILCGKVAAGKSTLAAELCADGAAVLIGEDALLAELYRDQLKDFDDYIELSRRLRAALGPHIVALLKLGLSVVLDFSANTPKQRAWFRGLIEEAGCAHVLHFLDTPDATCKARLRQRNAGGKHQFTVSEAEFDEISRYFVAPEDSEGFDIVRYGGET